MPTKLKQSVFSNRNKEKSATYATANSLKKTRLGGLMDTTKAKSSIGRAQVSGSTERINPNQTYISTQKAMP